MAGRPSREAVARWNTAYAEQTTALFTAMRSGNESDMRRLARAYESVADAWRILAGDLDTPLWARHAASVASEEFHLRARLETIRADSMTR